MCYGTCVHSTLHTVQQNQRLELSSTSEQVEAKRSEEFSLFLPPTYILRRILTQVSDKQLLPLGTHKTRFGSFQSLSRGYYASFSYTSRHKNRGIYLTHKRFTLFPVSLLSSISKSHRRKPSRPFIHRTFIHMKDKRLHSYRTWNTCSGLVR